MTEPAHIGAARVAGVPTSWMWVLCWESMWRLVGLWCNHPAGVRAYVGLPPHDTVCR